MLQKKTLTPFGASARPSRPLIPSSLRRLLGGALTTALLVALLSYSSGDPSWTTWSTQIQFKNWLGRTGSYSADLLFALFGMGALGVAVLPLLASLRTLCSDERLPWKRVALYYALLVVSVDLLLQLWLPSRLSPWSLRHSGGLLGYGTAASLMFLAGKIGAGLLGLVGLFASLILIFDWDVVHFLTQEVPPRVRAFLERVITSFRVFQEKRAAAKRAAAIPVSPPISQPETAVAKSLPPLPVALPAPVVEVESPPSRGGESGVVINPTYVPPAPKAPKVPRRVVKGNGHFDLPQLNLLSGRAESKTKTVDRSWFLEKANILVQKLRDFGVEGEVVNISPGPVITVYEFKPASGVKIKEIANLSDDLTLALSVLSVRIVAPIPGKPVVGIEIPSPHREMVFFKDLIQETPFFTGELKIPIALGRLASGEPLAVDLASMPHLLIAGSTGTGKSVFINTLICSLLYRFAPSQLKMILVDPKMVELSTYEGIPHLLLPVVVDSKKAVLALRWAVEEMERRYTLMHQTGVRHIDAYNERLLEHREKERDDSLQPIPYIVVVIDEYADLMAVVPKDVELSIARLAQKARASGIHLVLATQRPSTDVVTGTIKANFPSRISFRVASSIDSKTILDRTGSERLLGHGDLLFHSAGFNTIKRMQGPFLSDSELEKIVEHLKSQGEPEYDERILQAAERELPFDEGGSGSDEDHRLYDAAVRLVTEKGEASISLIQRHLRIGYNRAAVLMEQLEKEGVVGESTGPAKRRSVLVGSL